MGEATVLRGRLGSSLASLAVLAGSACAGGDFGAGPSTFTGAVDTVTATATDSNADATAMGGSTGDTGSTSDPSGNPTSNSSTDPTDSDPTTGPGEASTASGPTDTGDPCVPAEEVCDGEDNDCDDDIDEDVAGVGDACDTGNPGACAMGVMGCVEGVMSCQGGTGGAETCNGADDDCNGMVDDGNPGGGGACDTGNSGVCATGINACVGGRLDCVQSVQSSAETCDNEDDDCDGIVDDGNPDGGGGCSTGLLGVCAAGTQQCQGGGLSCVQSVGAGGEVCDDALDNDCDGTIDNGCGCDHDVCTAGAALDNDCHACVPAVCALDAFCCNNSWDGLCVGEVETACGSALCLSPSCAHLVCSAGVALASDCHSCVTEVCAVDLFCCSISWDGVCVGEVGSICGLTC